MKFVKEILMCNKKLSVLKFLPVAILMVCAAALSACGTDNNSANTPNLLVLPENETFTFTAASYTAIESAADSTVEIDIELSESVPANHPDVILEIDIEKRGGITSADYTITTPDSGVTLTGDVITVIFTAGSTDTRKSFTVDATSDSLSETAENLALTLSQRDSGNSDSNYIAGGIRQANVWVVSFIALRLGETVYNVAEGESIDIFLQLYYPAPSNVTLRALINISCTNCADVNTDYTITGTGVRYISGTNNIEIDFVAGQEVKAIRINALNDSLTESSEFFDVFVASQPVAGYIGDLPSSARINIFDR